jgi:Tfp pilus assembly protein PilO
VDSQVVSLQTQIRLCTRVQWTLAIVLFLTGAGFYFLGYRPAMGKLKALHLDTAAKETELCENMKKSQFLGQVAQEVKALRVRLDGAKKLPKDADVPGFINDLTRISQSTAVRKPQYKPDPQPRRRELFFQYPIQITLQGNFVNVFNFIREAENLPRLARVRTIDLQGDPLKGGAVTANITVDLYFTGDE